jgi:hypothetical protein
MEKKPTLTVAGKRAFIEYSLELVEKKQPKAFFNSLVVSKEFLNVSKYYSIYSLDIRDASIDFEEGCLRFMNLTMFKAENHHLVGYPYIDSLCFHLSCEKTCSFISLLKPSHVSLNLCNSYFSEESLQNCTSMFDRVDGKIAVLTNAVPDADFTTFVNQFAGKIRCVCMLDSMFGDKEIVPFPKLELCVVEETIKMGQLDEILRHKINTLVIAIDEGFFGTIEEMFASMLTSSELNECESLERLLVNMPDIYGRPFMLLFGQITQLCRKLRKVHLDIPFEFQKQCFHEHVKETSGIVRRLSKNYSIAKSLIDNCMNLKNIELTISSNLTFRFDVEYDCKWVEAFKKNKEFKGFKHHDVSPLTGKLKQCVIEYQSSDPLYDFRQKVHIVYVNPAFAGDHDTQCAH